MIIIHVYITAAEQSKKEIPIDKFFVRLYGEYKTEI